MTKATGMNIEKSNNQTLDGITWKKDFNFSNFRTINNLSRQYLMLMMEMQESHLQLNLFSTITFDNDNPNPQKIINVRSTALTEYFLTRGLTVYQFTSLDGNATPINLNKDRFPLHESGIFAIPVGDCPYNDEVHAILNDEYGVPTTGTPEHDSHFDIDTSKTYTNSRGHQFKVAIILRQSGCGFGIPENATIQLDPRLVWCQTKLKLTHNDEDGVNDSNDGLYIVNFAGGAQFYRDRWSAIESLDTIAFMVPGWGDDKNYTVSTSMQELSNSKTELCIYENKANRVDKEIIIMPFICCAFDMLTEVYFNNNKEPMVLFST